MIEKYETPYLFIELRGPFLSYKSPRIMVYVNVMLIFCFNKLNITNSQGYS